jgi:hypothetical protein
MDTPSALAVSFNAGIVSLSPSMWSTAAVRDVIVASAAAIWSISTTGFEGLVPFSADVARVGVSISWHFLHRLWRHVQVDSSM